MLEQLSSHALWMEFLAYKTGKQLLSQEEAQLLQDFVENRRYLPLAEQILRGAFVFPIPERIELNKLGTRKKRVVYRFPDDVNILLKMVAYLLYRYDDALPDNCYAFRKSLGPRSAFMNMAETPDLQGLHGFKADVSNYFNSIDTSLLIPMLQQVVTDDEPLLRLLTSLLDDDRALWQGEVIHEPRGVMAGTPTSPFFANLYLREMDAFFSQKGVVYARYSDDILLFAKADEIDAMIADFHRFMARFRLQSNPDKAARFAPGEAWEFLGFRYDNGTIDIARSAQQKLRDKVRRAARSIRRWMLRKNASPEQALRVFNRKFNRKVYENDTGRELCWCRWYFPLLTTDASLRAIDRYIQDWQRYIVTGRHNKANYRRVPYAMLTACGYRPLVHAYYDRSGSHSL